MEIGFIGLGRMGRSMVERLLDAGHELHVHNRSPAAVEDLAARGASAASSVPEVGRRSQVVLTALQSNEAVLAVFRDLSEVFADHSTVNTDVSHRCAAMLKDNGVDFLDAPVSGGPSGAASRTLTAIVGGNPFWMSWGPLLAARRR